MHLVETAKALDRDAGLEPMRFSSGNNVWVEQWFWRSSEASSNGLEAVWFSAAPLGRHDHREARVFLASKGPYRGQWRAYVSAPDSLQAINLKDTSVGTFSNHRDAMAAVSQYMKMHIDRIWSDPTTALRQGGRR